MGAWGAGNFENDSALDMVGTISDVADKELQGFLKSKDASVEDLDQVVACAEVRLALIDRCGGAAPAVNDAMALRKKVLKIYDAEIDDLESAGDYKVKRRQVIEDTLNRLVDAAEAFWKRG